ncbi:hypothetical protein DY000_02048952 [Brassica cretica]|uniref:Uncharacterized protein n=1 Tax=Brassica cretica TaxID=69181 RepID=A0ABQ7ETV8_BRACR|nr:hypothetical protein DY000_02048952 [Brassica cretica]
MLPTRFFHAETLADLGIDEDVFETLHAIGIAPLCYTTHGLYPDLARQVLATATITYEDSNAPSYANCSFSFMAMERTAPCPSTSSMRSMRQRWRKSSLLLTPFGIALRMGTLHSERLTSRRSGTRRFVSLQRSSQTSCSLKISPRRSPTGSCKPCTLVLRMKSELLGPAFQFKRSKRTPVSTS